MPNFCSKRLLLVAFLLIPGALGAQEIRTVTGTVTELETLQAFPGVEIGVKGTKILAVTNAEGFYTIRVPAGAETLVASYLGYRTQEMAVAPRVDVQMSQEAIGIEGLTVTALGVKREKRSLGYSVQDVSGADISEVPELNIVNSLKGKVAGVQITNAGPTGGSARIVIRGASSIGGSNQPLFIVDGVPIANVSSSNDGFGGQFFGTSVDYGNTASDLDPANIESISVLKGPNAAALYGSRAAGGAVVITTKSGRGAPDGGLGITASMSLTMEEPLRLPTYQNRYGQGLFGEFNFVDGAGDGLWDHVDESWGPALCPEVSGCETLIDQFTGVQQPWVAQPGNVRDFFRTGTTLNTNVALARAGERSNVRLSITDMELTGMSPGNSMQRIGVALKGGATLTERLSAEASVNYIDTEGVNRPGTGYGTDNPMQQFIWFGRQVDLEQLRNYRCSGGEATPCIVNDGQYNWNYNYHNNPFWEALVNTNGDERDRLIGHLNMDYQLNDWVTASARVGRDWYRDHRKRVTAPNSLDDDGFGSFSEETLYRSETNVDVLVSATRQLTSDLTLDVAAGGNSRSSTFEGSGVGVSRLTAPGIYTIDNAAVSAIPWDQFAEKEVRSLYGSATLNYRGYWNLDLTGRNDWSSTLPKANNSYFYPSVSTAFVFTDAFQLQNDVLSSGKVRGSWTRVGSDAGPYQLEAVYSAQPVWAGEVAMFAVPNQLTNAALKPEETTAWEVGADLGFFDERLGFVLTYYQRTTGQQILNVETSRATGYSGVVLNAGEIANKGFEVLLRAMPVDLDNGFRWDMTVNWSWNSPKVTKLFGDMETLVLGSYWSMNIEARLGEPYGAFYGNGYLRCTEESVGAADCASDQIGMVMLSSGGVPLIDPERRVLGNYNPDWIGGIQNRFSWGPLDVSVLVDGQAGGDVFSTTNWWGEYTGVLESTLLGRTTDFCEPGIVVQGVLPDGSSNGDGTVEVVTCPQDFFHGNFGIQAASIEDASYMKLREVRIGYEFPTAWLDAVGFRGGNLSLIGRNLFLWSNIENIDPETAFDASNVQGIEFGQFPTARSIGFSLSLRP